MQPIGSRSRHPFDGKPETRVETDEKGNVLIRVSGRVLTPWGAKIADKLGKAAAGTVTVAGVMYVLDHNLPPIDLLPAGAMWLLHPVFEKLCREGIKRRVEMVVTAAEFSFRTWMGQWITFDRSLPHRFSLKIHDLARQERDQHELETAQAQQRRKIVQPRRYYQESYHFIYELLGQRNDITEIFGQPEAQAVLTRLRAVDEVINARGGGDGTALKPGDQYADGPGAIP